MPKPKDLNAAIAAHRFGLGEATLDAMAADPQGWLLAQLGPADAALGDDLPDTAAALAGVAAERRQRQAARQAPPGMGADATPAPYREVIAADQRSRLATAVATRRPWAERLHLFWANHFTVSLAKGSTRGLVGAFEREAIRPHIAARFEDLLSAAVTHPAMLRYLDNVQSAGPRSPVVGRAARRAQAQGDEPRVSGLNENLARELLELHTLGAQSARAGIYTQADVSAMAALLTGWRVSAEGEATAFDAAWHEPGDKPVLGRRYAEGPQALRALLHDLAQHPATATYLCTKLARHVVADEPPPALVDRLVQAWRHSDGRLDAITRALVASPEAWVEAPAKLKTPEEFVISALRLLGPEGAGLDSGLRGAAARASGVATVAGLGQRLHHAPSPAGWGDRADDWLGPDAVWKRIEWATRVADRLGSKVDARAVATRSLGPLLGADGLQQIERAADGPQALALLLMAPAFQRR